jgi:hypothetical protein
VSDTTAGIRDSSLLAVSVVLGVAVSALVPWIGLPIAAAGIAGLVYRNRTVVAAAISALGVAAAAIVNAANVVFTAPAIVALLLAVVMLPRVDVQIVGLVLVTVFTVAGFAADAVIAQRAGTTISAQIAEQSQAIVAELGKSLGASATPDVVAQLKSASNLMQAVWPSTYFESALFVAVLSIAAIAWAARRAGRDVKVPALSKLDLTPHVLWAFVVGLLLLAASRGSFPQASVLWSVGLNLVLCVRALFFLQGLGVAAGVLDRMSVGLGGRIFALAALAALDALTFALSFIGLVDFWVNFRRLPRDGAPPAPAHEAPEV